MPTSNPRITVTLQPAVHALLRRMSELTGNSQSALVSEILEQSSPVFERVVRVLEAANEAKEEMRGKVAADLANAQAKLERQLGLSFEAIDEGFAPLLREAEAIKRRARRGGVPARGEAPRRAKSGGVTPLSNRGVRSQGKKAKKSTRTRG